MKIEEQIRKGKEQYEEVLQRAVAAEVSPAPGGLADRAQALVCSVLTAPGAPQPCRERAGSRCPVSPAASSLFALTLMLCHVAVLSVHQIL